MKLARLSKISQMTDRVPGCRGLIKVCPTEIYVAMKYDSRSNR